MLNFIFGAITGVLVGLLMVALASVGKPDVDSVKVEAIRIVRRIVNDKLAGRIQTWADALDIIQTQIEEAE